MNRSQLRATAASAVLLCLLLLPSAPTIAASCPLTVTPASGAPGTRFNFKGSGYTPTDLHLVQDDKPTKIVPLQLNGADPFEFSIVASEADVGRWKAVAISHVDNCRGTVTLEVTLPPTATSDPAMPDRTPIVMAISGLGALFLTVAIAMFRRSRRFGVSF